MKHKFIFLGGLFFLLMMFISAAADTTDDTITSDLSSSHGIIKLTIDNFTESTDFLPTIYNPDSKKANPDVVQGSDIKAGSRQSAELDFSSDISLIIVRLQPEASSLQLKEQTGNTPINISIHDNTLKITGCDASSPFICEGEYRRSIKDDPLDIVVEIIMSISDRKSLGTNNPPSVDNQSTDTAPEIADNPDTTNIIPLTPSFQPPSKPNNENGPELDPLSQAIDDLDQLITHPSVPKIPDLFK